MNCVMTKRVVVPTRRDKIIASAIDVFVRYGYARTTMVDIAEAADLTRPTLYAAFPDKESIFSAVVETMVADKITEIRQRLEQHRTLESKLRFACDAWAAEGYDFVRRHPDAADMFDLGFKSVCTAYEGFAEVLAGILDEPARRSRLKLSPADIARTIVFAMKGFKDTAATGDEIREMIRIHSTLVAAAVEATAK